jgi:ABC-2 type transport system ATP-binding protein
MVDDSMLYSKRKSLHQDLVDAGWPSDVVSDHLGSDRHPQSLDGSAIVVTSLSKAFGDHEVLKDVSFVVKAGEIFGLIGLSGSGKTTLMNMMVGFIEPDAGDVVVCSPSGQNVSVLKSPELIKSVFGFSAQRPSFYAKLSVKENLAYFGELFGLSDQEIMERSAELISLVGLAGSEAVLSGNLSGGMQKRLDIACAMIHKPNILLLDEPTADLDSLLRAQMWKIIRDINKAGTTVVVASHFIEDIENYCSRIAVLNNKTVSLIGSSDDIKNKYTSNYEVQLRTSSEDYKYILSALKKSSLFASHKIVDAGIVFYTSSPKKLLSELFRVMGRKGEGIVSLDLARPSLKEAFESLVK